MFFEHLREVALRPVCEDLGDLVEAVFRVFEHVLGRFHTLVGDVLRYGRARFAFEQLRQIRGIQMHMLGEDGHGDFLMQMVVDVVQAYIDDPAAPTEELMEYLPGPDFPTGGIIANKSELPQIYETGVGKIKLRGRFEVELGKRKVDKDKLM